MPFVKYTGKTLGPVYFSHDGNHGFSVKKGNFVEVSPEKEKQVLLDFPEDFVKATKEEAKKAEEEIKKAEEKPEEEAKKDQKKKA